MKKLALFAALAAMAVGAPIAGAKDASNPTAAVRELTRTPAAELPAAAAKLVAATPKQSQPAMVNAIMRKVARTHPVALHHVVAAVAKVDPELASVAAASAARAHPEGVMAIVNAACNAAPDRAAEILAVASKVSVATPKAMATAVASANPVFSAETLTREVATLEITSHADVVTGGTVIDRPDIPPGAIGVDLQGNEVLTAPIAIGPGTPGFDPDRYAAAGR